MFKTAFFSFFILLALFAVCSFRPAFSALKEDRAKILRLKQESKKEILRRNQSRLDEEKAKLSEFNKKENDLSAKLKQTESSLWMIEDDIRLIMDRQARISENIARKRADISSLKEQVKVSQTYIASRLREINKRQISNYWAVLFNSENFYDFITRLDFIKRVTENDLKTIKELKLKRKRLEREEIELLNLQASLKEQEAELRKRQILQDSLRKEQRAVLDDVSAQKSVQAGIVYDLELITYEQNLQLENLIRQEQALYSSSPSSKSLKTSSSGAFTWPCNGVITSPYGYRWHPIRGGYIFHSGLDIGADYGVPIRAASDGVVIMSGWYGGYGNCLIIDHGGGWSTLYGHCSVLFVSKGQSVSKGTAVASVGSTGMSTGPHVHFEVRYNGSPVDPYSKLP